MPLSTRQTIKKLVRDDLGLVVSTELILLAIIVAIGMVTGLAAARDALTSELSDTAGSLQDLNQTYRYAGVDGTSATTVGSNFSDRTDAGDTPEDLSGQADNFVVFDFAPTNEFSTPIVVSDDQQVLLFEFDGNADDGSPFGNNHDGTLRGDAFVADGALHLDGNGDYVAIPNSPDINLQDTPQRTIFIEFTADDVSGRQVLFEEGGNVRGLNIYIDNGQLYVGAYNLVETNFQSFISTPIVAGQTFSAALVLDAGTSVQAGALQGFSNGQEFGNASASQIYGHPGAIGLGGLNRGTVFHDGVNNSSSGLGFAGQISAFQIYNRPLSSSEVQALSQ